MTLSFSDRTSYLTRSDLAQLDDKVSALQVQNNVIVAQHVRNVTYEDFADFKDCLLYTSPSPRD